MKHALRARLTVLLSLAGVPAALAQTGSWAPIHADPGPAPGYQGPMTFDEHRARMVLVTGGQTWEAAGSTWRPVGPAPGGGLIDGCMVYDPVRRETIWFGGRRFLFAAADTWSWNGATWTRRQPVTSPPARSYSACAYDRARDRIVLFGGEDATFLPMNDTWEWDGSTWAQCQPASRPSVRGRHRMVYDSARGVCVMYGGIASSRPQSDTWEWDGTNWTPRGGGPGPLWLQAMAYDERRARTVMTSSTLFAGALRTTWEWDGIAWSSAPATGRFFSQFGAAAYDSLRRAVVLVAADDAGYHVRRWERGAWRRTTPFGAASPIEGVAAAYDGATRTVVRFGGGSNNGLLTIDLTMGFRGGTWRILEPANQPSSRMDAAMAADATGGLVLFGGRNPTALADTWRWNGSDWQVLSPANSPPARSQHGMVFDSTRRRIVLFGGVDSTGTAFNDTWEWDGVDWRQSLPAVSPPSRVLPAMAFDSARNRTVMFGGGSLSQPLRNDLWEWDGSAWTARTPATTPSPRANAQMAFDPLRGVTVMAGGFNLGFMSLATPIQETWEWAGTRWFQVGGTQPAMTAYDSGVYHEELRRVLFTSGGVDSEFGGPSIAAAAGFGQGCAGASGEPELSAVGPPRTGNSQFALWATSMLPGAFTVFGLDSASTSIPLGGGCTALLPQPVLLVAQSDSCGNALLPLAIPALPGLRGANLFAQVLTLDPAGSLARLAALSAGLRITLD